MKTKTFKTILFSFDGEYISERNEFNEISEAWDYINNMGSKWYFYPFCFVASGKTIVDAPDLLWFFIGKRITTVKKAFKELYNKTEDQSLGIYDYMALLSIYL